jgi:hypothetical protein
MIRGTMMRTAFRPSGLAVALQAASLLAVAAGALGILIADISRHNAATARVEAPSSALLLAVPRDPDAQPR